MMEERKVLIIRMWEKQLLFVEEASEKVTNG